MKCQCQRQHARAHSKLYHNHISYELSTYIRLFERREPLLIRIVWLVRQPRARGRQWRYLRLLRRMLDGLVARAFRFRLRKPHVYDMARARSKQPAASPGPAPRRSALLRRRCLQQPQQPVAQVIYEDAVCVALRPPAPAPPHLLLVPRRPPSVPLSAQEHDEMLAHLVVTGARLGTARGARGLRLTVEGAGVGDGPLRVHVLSGAPG